MDEVHNQSNGELIHCRCTNTNNNNASTESLHLDNRGDDPLRAPEVTVNLNERCGRLPIQPLEEPEEDMFDYDTDISLHEGCTESEEQVVPSSQLSNNHKYPDELTISDDELDEGIFEDDSVYSLALADDNNRYDSQPP